jgi:hypothetical protein
MILDDEDGVEGLEDIIGDLQVGAVPMQRGLTFQDLITGTSEILNSDTHFNLRGDLIEHLWKIKGANMISLH